MNIDSFVQHRPVGLANVAYNAYKKTDKDLVIRLSVAETMLAVRSIGMEQKASNPSVSSVYIRVTSYASRSAKQDEVAEWIETPNLVRR